jgi:hypothetical protein
MKSRHNLKTIGVVTASPPDGAHNSRGVKKYRKIEKIIVVLILFHPSTVYLLAALELLRRLLNDDALKNVKQLEIHLILFYVP